MNNRQPILDALAALSDVSFLLTMSAAAGVAKATAAAIVDDPTPEHAFADAVSAWQSPGAPDYLSMSPDDPRYASKDAQIARLQHLLDYGRQHAPDPATDAWLQQQIAGVKAQPDAP